MEPIQLGFDYAALDTETRAFVEGRARAIHTIARMTAAGIVQIGQHLNEVKERLKEHNKGRSHQDQERLGFLEWIKREFAWKEQSARNFMMVYDRFKSTNFGDLEIDISALYLIAAPSTPEPVREEVVRVAISGERVSHGTVKAVIAQYNKTGDADAAVSQIFRAVAEARKEAAAVLPSPSEARRTAIATGAHTLDRNGVYQPPMTVEQQADYKADMMTTDPAYRFCQWVGDGTITPEGAARIIVKRQWKEYYRNIARAIEWLEDFREALRCNEEK
jgi:hypothetical protein